MMTRLRRTQDFMCGKGGVCIPAALLSIILYFSDVSSDLYLADQHYDNDDVVWARFTVAFILVPWILSLLEALGAVCRDFSKRHLIFLVAALFNVYPVAPLFLAIWRHCTGDKPAAVREEQLSCTLRLHEILFESLPQLLLQLYIASRTNHLNILAAFAISTSLASFVHGFVEAIFADL